MVSVISSFRSIRVRLIFIVIVVIAALLFQTLFLLSSEELQNNVEAEGENYLQIDSFIQGNLTEAGAVLESIRREQISTILSDILFKDELDEDTGVESFDEFNEIIENFDDLLDEREEIGYLIDPESSNIIYSLISTFQNPSFGGYDVSEPIITRGDLGAEGQFHEYEDLILVNRTRNNFDPTTNITTIVEFELYLPNSYFDEAIKIRRRHNNNIGEVKGDGTNTGTEGVLATIQFNLNEAVEFNEGSGHENESEILFTFLEEFRQMTDYVLTVSRFEKLFLGPSPDTQAVVNSEIDNIITDLQVRSDSIEQLHSDILDLTSAADIVILNNERLMNIAFSNVQNRVLDALENNGKLIGELLEDTAQMIFIVEQVLIEEQSLFKREFADLLDQLDEDLQSQTIILSLLIIFTILILVGSTSLTLVRYFNRYESNYKMIEAGNLNIPMRKSYGENELGRVDRGFDNMIVELKRILTALQRSSERMAGIAEELAAGAEEASASVQEVSNTVREFSAGAAEQNLMLNRVDEKMTDHLQTIEDATRQINETSNFVLKVAKRTNILGLNASIEAAKAGRFGLGFNVVAEEVRNLSDDTKGSALEIAGLIENIESKIQNTVRDILNEVNITKDVAENTAAGSEEANAATSEQVVMLNEISQTSNELSLLANELQEILSRFTL